MNGAPGRRDGPGRGPRFARPVAGLQCPAMDAREDPVPTDDARRTPSTGGFVATCVLIVLLAAASFVGVRRALTISLPLDVASALVSAGLLVWVVADLRRRLSGCARRPVGRLHRWFALRPAFCGWALLLPIAAWFALRIPGPMGEGPVAVPFDHGPWARGAWHEGPVLAVSLGDSVATGYGAPPGRGFFDLVVRNDRERHPDVGSADLSSVFPRLKRLKLATLSSSSIDHERDVASLPLEPRDTFGLVFLSTGGIDLIHPYGHGKIREGAMYGATLAEARPWIERFEARIDRMLEALSKRFPGGCEVFVGTIYDPTDGVGDIEHAGVAFWLPPWPEALEIHGRFNAAIRSACARHSFAHVVDVHRVMLGHGIHCRDPSNPHYDAADPTYWYFFNLEDPNERGYDAIRRLFLARLGDVLPARLAALAPPPGAGPR